MIKSNKNDLLLSLWDFNKAIPNDRNNCVINNTIPNGINNGAGIDLWHGIYLYFDLEVHDEAYGLFGVDEVDGTSFPSDDTPDIGHPEPLLVRVAATLEEY